MKDQDNKMQHSREGQVEGTGPKMLEEQEQQKQQQQQPQAKQLEQRPRALLEEGKGKEKEAQTKKAAVQEGDDDDATEDPYRRLHLSKEVRQLILEEQKRIREEERQRAQQALEKERQRAEKNEQLKLGQYYSTITQVWGLQSLAFDALNQNHFNKLRRESAPNFCVLNNAKKNEYQNTVTAALEQSRLPVDKSTRSSNKDKSVVWPMDIFGKNDLQAPIAHLVPFGKEKAPQYFDVAIWAFGLQDNSDWNILRKCIQGSKMENGTKREQSTGLIHFISNKIRLSGQAEYFDLHPCVIIVPILNVEQMKAWNGAGYSAIVMADAYDAEGDECLLKNVCRQINMLEEGPVASQNEIETARKLLEEVLCGLAFSLYRRQNRIPDYLSDKAYAAARAEREKLKSFLTGRNCELKLPKAQTQENAEVFRVRKIEFVGHEDDNRGESNGSAHLAPDPLLLTVKAAVNWSWRNSQKLLASADPEVEEDELDILAMEQYLDWRESRLRPRTWEDLSRGLHQPNGYQEQST